jgi:hypothetical protein
MEAIQSFQPSLLMAEEAEENLMPAAIPAVPEAAQVEIQSVRKDIICMAETEELARAITEETLLMPARAGCRVEEEAQLQSEATETGLPIPAALVATVSLILYQAQA